MRKIIAWTGVLIDNTVTELAKKQESQNKPQKLIRILNLRVKCMQMVAIAGNAPSK